MCDGADGRQCLAAEAERRDVEEVVAVELRRGVALDAKREVGRVHAVAVIGDADERKSAIDRDDLDLARAGVDGVLDQLLDHARRPLHHLAGGDAVHGLRAQLADRHGAVLLVFVRLAGLARDLRRLREASFTRSMRSMAMSR